MKDTETAWIGCVVAKYVEAPACHDALFEMLAQHDTDGMFQLRGSEAASFQGFRFDVLQFWADRVGRPRAYFNPLEYLSGELLSPKPEVFSLGVLEADLNSDQAATLKANWTRFLTTHRAKIEAGKRFDRTDAQVQALFPPGLFRFY